MEIGKIIQQLREEKNMLQADLAQALGVSRTTISNYENSYSYPDLTTLTNIAHYFHVSTDYLLGISEIRNVTTITNVEETKVLKYYNRLDSENKDYINGEMIRLFRKQELKDNAKNSEAVKNTTPL